MTIKLDLELSYTLEAGAIAPHLDGLRRGEAVARRCAGCGRITFGPERTCGCGAAGFDWIQLTGRGLVRAATQQPDAAFALVTFDGAHNAAVARVRSSGPVMAGDSVVLVPDGNGHDSWPTITVASSLVARGKR